ncbi:MAG: FHA domain-containing protein [Gemmatimonadaceae bacterium]|nr:FHA domain-containing protein [Gemmatimonadaceae bacterium]
MRVSLAGLFIILGTLATATLAIVAAMWMNRRRRDEELRAHGNPLLVVSGMSAGPLVMPAGSRATPPATSAHRSTAVDQRIFAQPLIADVAVPLSGPISAVEDPVTATTGRFAPGTIAPEVVMGHSLRFHRPSDGTLQFLQGFLEVVGGPDAGHEVRFVHPALGESPDITFGRKEGPPYRHVQLLEPTVSRTHARLSPEGDRWRLTNLSRTNPVVVNGAALDGVNSAQLLNDDDLVEMGALVFRFRAR